MADLSGWVNPLETMFCKCWRVFRQSQRQEQADEDFDPLAEPPSLLPWAPVAMGLGICIFFSVRFEPPLWALWLGFGVAFTGAALVWLGRIPWNWRPFVWGAVLLALGFAIAGFRAHSVAAPVLSQRYYGPIEGRIVAIDVSGNGAVRLTLDRVYLGDTAPWRTPARVRVSLHGVQDYLTPEPGQFVMTTGHLSPPQGPVEPYGFDFRRMAWFQGLGAVGYTRNPVLQYAPADRSGAAMMLYRTRLVLSHGIQDRLSGPRGGFASAIITGDRAGLDQDLVEALRHSNLAHLLAISGLHMGLLTGLVFYILRLGFALSPHVALHWPTRKIAAVAALAVGTIYLGISGANIATQRAFIMVLVMFVAILIDRRALSLRSVAVAAMILQIWRPESVLGAGFQMSFAATTALIVGFDALRRLGFTRLPVLIRPVATILASSAIAGLATAPFAAAHFNIFASYGLIANLLAIPAMGFVVMPGAMLAAILVPFGAEALGLFIMGQGIDWILWVAQFVSQMEGGVRLVPMPGPWVVPLFVTGGLMLFLGPGRVVRSGAMLPLMASAVFWAGSDRPDVLISQTGALIGVRTAEGLVLSKERGESFAAENWLQHDGDVSEQAVAFARPGFDHARARSDWDLSDADLKIIQLRGKNAAEVAPSLCRSGVLLVSLRPVPDQTGRCQMFDAIKLRQTGSAALVLSEKGPSWVYANQVTGQRLWTDRDLQNRRPQDQ